MYDSALHWHNGFFSPVAQVTYRKFSSLHKKGDKEFNYNSSNAPLLNDKEYPLPIEAARKQPYHTTRTNNIYLVPSRDR